MALFDPVAPSLFAGISGTLGLSFGVAYSSTAYSILSAIDIPFDFVHHIKTNTLDGWYQTADDASDSILRGILNGVDYFLPLKLTMIPNLTENWNWGFSTLVTARNESEQGFFRLSRPGLGKTGLDDVAEGRPASLNLWELAPYYYPASEPFDPRAPLDLRQTDPTDTSPLKVDNSHPFAPKITAQAFCEFAGEMRFPSTPDIKKTKRSQLRQKFYSFDAGLVYDSDFPDFVGAHSDLRDVHPPAQDFCRHTSSDSRTALLHKSRLGRAPPFPRRI